MLRIGRAFTNDPEIDEFVRNHINETLKAAVKGLIMCIEKQDGNMHYCFSYSEVCLDFFFPKKFPKNSNAQKITILKGLYALLNSDEEFVPTLVMEYVLSKIIAYCDDYTTFSLPETDASNAETVFGKDGMKEIHVVPNSLFEQINYSISEEMETRIQAAYKEFYREINPEFEDEAEEDAEQMTNALRCISGEWLDFCFWDADYQLLDNVSQWNLSQSKVNKVLGAMPKSMFDDAFYLPSDWEHSKDFHFLNSDR